MNTHQQNTMTTQLVITIITIGLAAGILSGMVGVGGGIILVPAMVFFLNYGQQQAQGMSLGVLLLPVMILGFIKYYHECAKMGTPIDIKVIGLLAIGFVVGSYVGSSIAVKLDKELLKKIFAFVLFYTAIHMLNWDTAFIKWVKGLF